MTKRWNWIAVVFTAVAAFTATPAAQAAMECRDLALLRLPGTLITTAEERSGTFSAGFGRPMQIPSICRVAGTINPAIRFEVWLPENYNGRLQAVGGGGLAGSISHSAMATAVNAGFASASTDTGHRANDSLWLKDPQRREDYGHRAIHEMTVKAKAIIDAYYGTGPEYSYFNGCSTGGRQGLMEAQRYPDDYDGIISGAPVNTFTRLHMGQLWTAHATLTEPGAALTPDDLNLVTDAVLAQCDANDGVEDGILTDPSACNFNPRELVCRGRSSGSCLAEPKVAALEKIYAGAVNPRTGELIYPGLEPGSERAAPGNPGWALIMNGRTPFNIDVALFGGMAYENDDWDWRTFDYDKDVTLIDAKLAHVLNAVDPDLRDFKDFGGKLIIYHGWNDPGVMPQRTIDYYDEVIAFADRATNGNGTEFTAEYSRLYMMPGMGHCRGGPGPEQADFVSALVDWVENDNAPDRIVASTPDGSMSRPLCPHPQVAVYSGSGDTNDAANFRCE
ncbi:MAG: tannase/feruloyl esterase family alpha/beta hydrolase [Gammaproteobacteria bacterium]|jgi:feruloyl esterase